MASNLYLLELSKKSRKGDKYARWRLGEILHEMEQSGYQIKLDRQNEIFIITEKCSDD